MVVSDYAWVDRKTKNEVYESSHAGTHFDTPYHFEKEGEKNIPLNKISGPALVVDIRKELVKWSDGYAITKTVIEKWIEAVAPKERTGTFLKGWERILLRTLSDKDAAKEEPMRKFPYFDSGETAETILLHARKRLGRGTVKLICTESPSVDHRDCGRLSTPDINGKGGAHGAFHRHGVSIGENWDFRNLDNMTFGILHVFFDTATPAPDAVKVYTAVFEID